MRTRDLTIGHAFIVSGFFEEKARETNRKRQDGENRRDKEMVTDVWFTVSCLCPWSLLGFSWEVLCSLVSSWSFSSHLSNPSFQSYFIMTLDSPLVSNSFFLEYKFYER